MFVKETYDERLRHEEEEMGAKTLLRKHKNPPIGSVKNDKLNYDRDEQFFSKDDVPERAKVIKQSVKNLIDPDHLGLRMKKWNASVSVPKKFEADETHEQRLLKIKLGFLDHPLPNYTEPKIYEGTDTRNDYTKWNVSNEVSRKQVMDNAMKQTLTAFENSKNKERDLLKEYKDPLAKTTTFIEGFKEDWQKKEKVRKQLRKKYQFQNPNASDEKTDAAVFRLLYETKIKEQKDQIEARAMKTDFKASLSQTQMGRIGVKSSHTGVWQCFKERVGREIEQTWAWSCCMNEDQKSSGCLLKVKDGNKWNLTSFNG